MMLAVVINPANRAYFLRESDVVYNGVVSKITFDSVQFRENYSTPTAGSNSRSSQANRSGPWRRKMRQKAFALMTTWLILVLGSLHAGLGQAATPQSTLKAVTLRITVQERVAPASYRGIHLQDGARRFRQPLDRPHRRQRGRCSPQRTLVKQCDWRLPLGLLHRRQRLAGPAGAA